MDTGAEGAGRKILIVDDEVRMRRVIADYLRIKGYETAEAADGVEALEKFSAENPDLVLLDVMLPDIDGFELLRTIRSSHTYPVIMLTARDAQQDKIEGLSLGADDYVVKPFEPKELIARIRAVLRRSADSVDEKADEDELSFDGLKINQSTYEVYIDDKKVEMPPKEFELLYFLAKNTNKVFTRDQLLDEIWGYEFFGDSRTVDVHIKRIREKLEGENRTWALKTVWGVGYKFEVS